MKLRRDRPDLLHVQYTAPVVCPVPVVVSVHDVSFLEHPEYFTARPRAAVAVDGAAHGAAGRPGCSRGASFRGASILGCTATWTRTRWWWCPTRPARSSGRCRARPPQAAVRGRFSIARPFHPFGGRPAAAQEPDRADPGVRPSWCAPTRNLTTTWCWPGRPTWFADQVRRGGPRIGRGRPHPFVGFVSDPDLLQLYNACDLFVFPSFYEGFGLPALEAMACGRAVACSNASALPEVVDSAAHPLRSLRADEMVRALRPICCWTRNCGRAWSGWDCSAPRTSVGRKRRRTTSWKYSTRWPTEPARRAAGPQPGAPMNRLLDIASMSFHAASGSASCFL